MFVLFQTENKLSEMLKFSRISSNHLKRRGRDRKQKGVSIRDIVVKKVREKD